MKDLSKSQAVIQTIKPAADNAGIQQCKILHCIKPALWQAIHLLPLLLGNCFRESGCCPKQNIHILTSFVAEQVLMQFEQDSIYQEWRGQEHFFFFPVFKASSESLLLWHDAQASHVHRNILNSFHGPHQEFIQPLLGSGTCPGKSAALCTLISKGWVLIHQHVANTRAQLFWLATKRKKNLLHRLMLPALRLQGST